MLQQTTVGAVRGRYERVPARAFPISPSLARAREESVLAAWSGLGYYARARNLRRAARQVVRDHGGRAARAIPAALRALPGLRRVHGGRRRLARLRGAGARGRRQRHPRALAPLRHRRASPARAPMPRAVRIPAEALLARGRPGDITAALMDLGPARLHAAKPGLRRVPARGRVRRARAGRCRALSAQGKARRRPARLRGGRLRRARDAGAPRSRRRPPCSAASGSFPRPRARARAAAARRLAPGARARSASDCLAAPRAGRDAAHHRPPPPRDRRVPRGRNARIRDPHAQDASDCALAHIRRARDAAAIPTLTRKIAVAAGFLPARAQRILGRHESRRVAPSDHGTR